MFGLRKMILQESLLILCRWLKPQVLFFTIAQFQNGPQWLRKFKGFLAEYIKRATASQDELYFFLDFRPPISTISHVDFFSRVASPLTMATSPFSLSLSRSFSFSLPFHRLIAINWERREPLSTKIYEGGGRIPPPHTCCAEASVTSFNHEMSRLSSNAEGPTVLFGRIK